MGGALSIRQAIHNTEKGLFSRLPAVAAIGLDREWVRNYQLESGNSWITPIPEDLTTEIFHQVGELPYVSSFDFVANHSFMSRVLRRYRTDYQPSSGAEQILLTGVKNRQINDLKAGLIQLREGRVFSENETHVAIVSESFAQLNNFSVGSWMRLESLGINTLDWWGPFDWPRMLEDYVLKEVIHDVEIVGIFEVTDEVGIGSPWVEGDGNEQLLNRIYLPSPLVETMIAFDRDFFREQYGHLPSIYENTNFYSTYLLHHPRYLTSFIEAANPLLPLGWTMTDLSTNFSPFLEAMGNILWIADLILVSSMVAILIIVNLLVIYFFRERRYEFGIYLTLGENKLKVLGQVLMELFSVGFLALAMSFFAGYLLFRPLSVTVLQQNLKQQSHEHLFLNNHQLAQGLDMFNPGQMSMEEMMEDYNLSFSKETFILFLNLGSIILLVSTLIPMSYILKQNPKNNLIA